MTISASGTDDPRTQTSGTRAEAGDLGTEARHQAERVRQEAERQAEHAKAHPSDLKDEVKGAASRMADSARDKARSMIEERKSAAAEEVASFAHALRRSADQLEHDEHGATARYLGEAAAGVDRLADQLRQQDFGGLMRETESFARRRPALFLGGAVAAGFALARFFKSSGDRQEPDYERPDMPTSGPTSPGLGEPRPESGRRLTPTEEGNVHVNR